MVEQIDELKQKYTDKYVVVDMDRPELARFRDTYGQVKTVNMSGRALVEFADYHLNIGWYDIDPSFLKLIDQPLPPKPKEVPAKAPEAKKPAGEPASASGGKPPKPAAPKPAAAPAKAGGAKMSVADMLAAARGGGASGSAPAPSPAKTQAKPAPVEEAAAEVPAPKVAAAPAKKSAGEKVDRKTMTVDQMIAWCRAHDAK